MLCIADTGFLVAFAVSRDMHHDWAVGWPKSYANQLSRAKPSWRKRLSFVEHEDGPGNDWRELVLSFDCNDHLPQLAALAKRYADRQPDLADLCLIRMSELYPHHRVITADKDFRVYRRNKREVIPLICPP